MGYYAIKPGIQTKVFYSESCISCDFFIPETRPDKHNHGLFLSFTRDYDYDLILEEDDDIDEEEDDDYNLDSF